MRHKIIYVTFVLSAFLITPLYSTTTQLTYPQIQDLLNDPDFGISPDKSVDYVMKEYTSTLHPDDAKTMVEKAGFRPSFGERVSVWIENAFIWIVSIPDRISLIYAKLTNNIEMQLKAEEAIHEYTKSMYYNKAAIGL